ncbi:hypothetical protein PGT21_037267 [Puccinia graminis f. sp. tritici]|uniref:Uncharacterized protein n=2 Tax=Puccinia graminis f. sp. tritici TaxID=56615 RepID=H6QS50_PUCGT|nr:uncharacterized protein PGTG_21697 [Puccinia graminis f. sp. tritici CRL 75-36-700-3]EHS63523.1 hypothetical protein PGTG_21697 [Puccinia graminis f. sp. tritici CRL 75-36-700-3]KAA1120210.1 hypothetical protein PGT21_037267 [Puccinia graminis f. sp. tritici]
MATPHLPPVSSPLAESGRPPTHPASFGANACKPKCYTPLPISLAPTIPMMTASGQHSYRITPCGIELMAHHEKFSLLFRRTRLRDIVGSSNTRPT